ncbi:MAG: hypothetical protein WEC59_07950 [Salibacteraceae bacterium]
MNQPTHLLPAIILSIAFSFSYNAQSQDCKKLLKKEKDNVNQTKDQELDRILVESHRMGFKHEEGKYYLEYFKTNIKPSAGPLGGSLGDAATESAFVDTIRVDLEFSNRDAVTYKFAQANSEMGGVSIKGTALRHYYYELTPEEMERFTKANLRKYRLLTYNGNIGKKLDDKKWKTIKSGNGMDIKNAANCLMKAVN